MSIIDLGKREIRKKAATENFSYKSKCIKRTRERGGSARERETTTKMCFFARKHFAVRNAPYMLDYWGFW